MPTDVGSDDPVELSVYVIEISLPPGGATLGHVHAFASADEVERALRYYTVDTKDITLPYFEVGARMSLWVVRDGAVSWHVDLRRFISPTLDVDWTALRSAIPALRGTLARRGVQIVVDTSEFDVPEDSYLQGAAIELDYGWNDVHVGDPAPDDWPLS